MSSPHQATLTVHGEAPIHFSVLSPTHGKDCLDIRALGAKTGRFAYDSGFESTASCKSKITFVDGERGELLYHGYPIEQLARQCDFLEVAYLLKNGELPNVGQKDVFAAAIRKQAPVHEQMVKFYQGFRRDARPMAVMGGVVGALSAFDHQASEVADAPRRELSFHRIVARMPTIVAMAYKYSIGEPFMNPRNDLGYTANFLYMMFATPREAYQPQPVLVRALDRLFVVHAEHGQDASTATVRMAGSSGANPFACVSAAIACLSGPAHAGAGEACLAMLEKIGDSSRVPHFVVRAKAENDSFRLIGFGHRVYRNFDPRAALMREVCDEVVHELGLENQRLFKVAKTLERITLEDPYFIEEKLYPNVDFYSAILLKALGIPASMFACIFALARTAGWMAQWEEMLADPEYKIARPRQLYTGVDRRQLLALPQVRAA
jgi:citrate synthase